MLSCGTRITAESSAPFEGVSLSGFLEHLFTFLELSRSLTLLSGDYTDALLSREAIGGVL